MNTVLIATERDLEQNLLAQALGTHGFDVVRTRDGLEALESARANPPQVLIANVSMPRMDGFALFRRCKQDEQLRGIPFILYSPRSNDEKSERFALELGATRFVSNALKPDALLRVVEEVLAANGNAEASAKKPSDAQPVAQVISLEARQLREHSAKLQQELQNSQAQLQTLQQQLQAAQLQAHTAQAQLADAGQAGQFISLFHANPVPMWLVNKASQALLAVNEAALRLFGYSEAEFLKLDNTTLLRNHSATPTNTTVLSFQHRDGRALSLILNSRDVEFQSQPAELIAAHDVTYRVRGERAIVDELQRVKTVLSAVPLPYWVIDSEGKLLDANDLYCQQSGYRREELLGRHLTSFLVDAPALTVSDRPLSQEITLKHKDGSHQAATLIAAPAEGSTSSRVALIYAREIAEPAAPAVNAHTRLAAVLETLRYADGADEATLLQYAIAQVATTFASPVALFAAVDKSKAMFDVLALSHAASPKRATNGHAISVSLPQVWRESLLQRRAELLSRVDECVELEQIGTLTNYLICPVSIARELYVLLVANRETAYDGSEQQELVDYGEILAALLALKRQQQSTHLSLSEAQRQTAATVRLLNRVLDTQDPYAIGSGARIASLSVAIGRELGLNEQRLSILNLAAQLHDIGHLALPRELFLQPKELTAAECALLETHPDCGAELLHGLNIDQDVAEIVAQHHERVDGTGYPRRLQGQDIIIEAKIVAVADVVEAMCAARAYRAPLGLAAALAELNKGSGQAYDAAVVAACLRIFATTNNQWPAEPTL